MMDTVTDEGTMSKITMDGMWLDQLWRPYPAQGRSRWRGVKPSGETIFIQFGLRLFEDAREFAPKQPNRGKRNACEWIQMSPYGVGFFSSFFLNEICGFCICSTSGLILGPCNYFL